MAANPPTTVLAGDVAAPPHQFQHPTPFIKSPYNYDAKAESDRTSVAPVGVSLTVQSMADDADLNNAMVRMGVVAKMPDVVRLPQFGDYTHVTDFQSAMNAVLAAEDAFMEIPAETRARFENNPQKLLDFVENPANIEQVKILFGEKNVARVSGVDDAKAAGSNPSSGASAPGSGGGTGKSPGGG